jgi:hypothetical protein
MVFAPAAYPESAGFEGCLPEIRAREGNLLERDRLFLQNDVG